MVALLIGDKSKVWTIASPIDLGPIRRWCGSKTI